MKQLISYIKRNKPNPADQSSSDNYSAQTIIQYIPLILLLLFVFTGCAKNGENVRPERSLAKGKEYYTCTMHPQIVSDRPGVCPICGMELIKKIADETTQSTAGGEITRELKLSVDKQVLANVSLYKIRREKLNQEFTSYSYLDIAEQNRKTISARFNGRIEKLFINKTGDLINKGVPLFEIYSPDLVQAQNEFLIALNDEVKGGARIREESKNGSSLLNAARKKLELFGFTQNQINELETKRVVQMTFNYYSPVNGTVIEKKVQEGVYVNEGNTIYEIADLSVLWNISEVYEDNLADVKVGSPVKLHLKAYPGEEFKGNVIFIYPLVDQQTRTIKIRSEFNNSRMKLKPQMYGETVFANSKGEGILVPAGALLFTGKRSVVWVKTGDGIFEAHKVDIGSRFGNKYQILSGLSEGDEIAATGGFLIDSESQLKNDSSQPRQDKKETLPPVNNKTGPGDMNGMKM